MEKNFDRFAIIGPLGFIQRHLPVDCYEKLEKMFIFKVQIIIPHNFRNTVSLTAENMPVRKYLRFDSISVCWVENHFFGFP